ncbi:MAG: hypothetical protein LBB18_03695 [Puniceicoccales bacterium]|nr:hypothetical protein [Puniceicoccales bacterium]
MSAKGVGGVSENNEQIPNKFGTSISCVTGSERDLHNNNIALTQKAYCDSRGVEKLKESPGKDFVSGLVKSGDEDGKNAIELLKKCNPSSKEFSKEFTDAVGKVRSAATSYVKAGNTEEAKRTLKLAIEYLETKKLVNPVGMDLFLYFYQLAEMPELEEMLKKEENLLSEKKAKLIDSLRSPKPPNFSHFMGGFAELHKMVIKLHERKELIFEYKEHEFNAMANNTKDEVIGVDQKAGKSEEECRELAKKYCKLAKGEVLCRENLTESTIKLANSLYEEKKGGFDNITKADFKLNLAALHLESKDHSKKNLKLVGELIEVAKGYFNKGSPLAQINFPTGKNNYLACANSTQIQATQAYHSKIARDMYKMSVKLQQIELQSLEGQISEITEEENSEEANKKLEKLQKDVLQKKSSIAVNRVNLANCEWIIKLNNDSRNEKLSPQLRVYPQPDDNSCTYIKLHADAMREFLEIGKEYQRTGNTDKAINAYKNSICVGKNLCQDLKDLCEDFEKSKMRIKSLDLYVYFHSKREEILRHIVTAHKELQNIYATRENNDAGIEAMGIISTHLDLAKSYNDAIDCHKKQLGLSHEWIETSKKESEISEKESEILKTEKEILKMETSAEVCLGQMTSECESFIAALTKNFDSIKKLPGKNRDKEIVRAILVLGDLGFKIGSQLSSNIGDKVSVHLQDLREKVIELLSQAIDFVSPIGVLKSQDESLLKRQEEGFTRMTEILDALVKMPNKTGAINVEMDGELELPIVD